MKTEPSTGVSLSPLSVYTLGPIPHSLCHLAALNHFGLASSDSVNMGNSAVIQLWALKG